MPQPSRSRPRRPAPVPPASGAQVGSRRPAVRLGRTDPDGVSPSIYALLRHGVERHPVLAARLRGCAVLRFAEYFPDVAIEFTGRHVRVEDRDSAVGDVVIRGRLPDVIHFAAAPHWRGVPKLTHPRGLAAIASYARGRVAVAGDVGMARGLVTLLALRE